MKPLLSVVIASLRQEVRGTESAGWCATLTRDQVNALLDVAEEAQHAGVNEQNPDTCGVCGKHFAECEEERSTHDEPPYTAAPVDWPSCPGARIRESLAAFAKTGGVR